ncbi:hypothetical protein C9439_00225 [archaeon SCG-AAA382B04]|nr:hypothetical protein C9439_00225 [archaeon SCG-AAA382B04]
MNNTIISLISLFTSLGAVLSIYLLYKRWDFSKRQNSGIFLLIIFFSFLFVAISNILEWSGGLLYLDKSEDYLEMVVPISLGLFPLIYHSENIKLEERKTKKRERYLHSLLTHNVKNKAQIIKGYLDLSKEGKTQERIKKANKTLDETIDMISKVRTLVKNLEMEREYNLSVNEFKSNLDKILENKTSFCNRKDITLKAPDKCQPSTPLKADELLFEVLDNIIENAFIHGDCQKADCKKIKVSCEETKDEFKIIVDDDGKGISDEEKQKVLKLNYSTRPNSSGLGLFLSSKIIQGYGGNLEVEDSPLGGARFILTLKRLQQSTTPT